MSGQPELPLPLPAPVAVRLSAQTLARLHAAGCGVAEIEAVRRVRGAKLRRLLIDFFVVALADDCRHLRAVVAVLLWLRIHGGRPRYGADILTNMARGLIPGFEGNNDHRCFWPRAVAIVRPDLANMLDMEEHGQAGVLFSLQWPPPDAVNWQSIEAWKPGGQHE